MKCGTDEEVDYDSESEGSFHYAGADPIESAPSMSSSRTQSTDYFARSPASRGPTDLTPHLSQAPEFRVPTHEVPQKVVTPRWTPPTPHSVHATWERDGSVRECRECRRRFNFLNRRVSCVPFRSQRVADRISFLACKLLIDGIFLRPRLTLSSIAGGAAGYFVTGVPPRGHCWTRLMSCMTRPYLPRQRILLHLTEFACRASRS